MNRRTWVLPMLSVLLFAACGGGEKTQVYRTDTGLAFEVPMDVLPSNPSSTVDGSGLLVGPGMHVTFDFGDSAAQPASGEGDVRVSLLSIDGHNAYAEYYTDGGDTTGMPYVASLFVADAGSGKSLAMVVRSADERGFDEAKKIFRSLEFEEVAARDAS